MSQSLIVPSNDPLARMLLLLKATLLTESEWPFKVFEQVPVAMSQSLIVSSSDPLTRMLLLLKATLQTQSEWPLNVSLNKYYELVNLSYTIFFECFSIIPSEKVLHCWFLACFNIDVTSGQSYWSKLVLGLFLGY